MRSPGLALSAPARRAQRESARAHAPEAEQGRRAIVLAGPPGAGKSTVLSEVLGDDRGKFLVVDADEFKSALLDEAIRDGSYEQWIKPEAVRDQDARGVATMMHAAP